jgi:excisionase family DNA binding protein
VSARRDPYAILGVPSTATQRQIRDAFRRQARELHPDTNPDPAAERAFKRLSRAYETLGDPTRRKAHDDRLTRGRFAAPGRGGPQTFEVETGGPIYHMDLGHHSDFYQAGDPLTVDEAAALVHRHPGTLRSAIRARRLAAVKDGRSYLLRRRDVERWDRGARRRGAGAMLVLEDDDEASEA